MLELAILGLLQEAPVHGYELRKQLGVRLGRRVFSYGSLYPALRRLVRAGLLAEDADVASVDADDGSGWARQTRRTYRITAAGRDRLTALLTDAGPEAVDDAGFCVHVAFFSRTPREARLRILQGRRLAVTERRDGLRAALGRAGVQIDRYTRELHRLGLESTEREVRWLDELIAAEATQEPSVGTEATQEPSIAAEETERGNHHE